jgi:hypothetical protein
MWNHLEKSSKEDVVKSVMDENHKPEEEKKDLSSGDLARLEIEPADNGGFTVTHHIKPKKTKSKDGFSPSEYQEPKRNVFSTHEEMIAHVGKVTK